MNLKTKGLIIREVLYKESDKLLTILTFDNGKITAKAKGVMSKSSKLAAACQLYSYSELELFEKDGRLTIISASPIELFFDLRQDIKKLSLVNYFCELLDEILINDHTSHELLRLALNSIYATASLKKPLCLLKAVFEIRLLSIAGFMPNLDGCSVCENPPLNAQFNMQNGVLHCQLCRDYIEGGISVPVSLAVIEAIKYISTTNEKRIFSFSLSENALNELCLFCEHFIVSQMEKSFKSLEYYKKL